jgi:hypothetical protein
MFYVRHFSARCRTFQVAQLYPFPARLCTHRWTRIVAGEIPRFNLQQGPEHRDSRLWMASAKVVTGHWTAI